MNKLFLLMAASFLLFSCHRSGNNPAESPASEWHFEDPDSIYNDASPDSIFVQIHPDGKADTTLYKKQDETIYILFDSQGYRSVTAELTSEDKNANIRFSQIFLPGGSEDGPFGQELTYNLPENGRYKISIHENRMAGDPWSGKFTVSLQLKK